MEDKGALLEVEHISKSYDNGLVSAVRDVSFSLERGKIYALTGPSGCGKSTLLNMLGAIDTPSSGTIRYQGKPLEILRPIYQYRRDSIGFVFQFHHLVPVLTLRENVEVAMLFNPNMLAVKRKEIARAQLQAMGLGEKIDAHANAVSGGERQRAAIARALVNRPALILADEPTGNIDSKTTKVILKKLQEYITSTNATMLVATHDGDVSAVADTHIKMKDGRIVEIVDSSKMERKFCEF